ncbi:CUE domain-containing protein 2 [Diabrotica virgifera virgifera]|uniref:CUE domain-containing protein 2 n=2 Tax=Diabrotica virgifera virgifera TaxID=50390 RepID=A0ABM5JYP7_DIAVI|nr:CUE domain-containing protein 2 [Diabrotica virgifera virgifera]
MSKKNIADQEIKIKDSLFEFVKSHIPDADLSLIDEIVLSYVISVLEDVGSDPVFDVEGFCEMMAAYFPEFETINHAFVCQWMFTLESKLQENDEPEGKKEMEIDLSLPEIVPKTKPRTVSVNSETDVPKRMHKLSETSDGGSTSDSSTSSGNDELDILQEMFPGTCHIEMKHCLTIAAGDVDRATQIIIDRQECGQSLNQNTPLTIQVARRTIDDDELKNRIIERYSYIDKDAFTKEHRPVAPKVEPKKMVRYRDNKIVSLKGERFTEVKKGEDVDDISTKKNKKGHTP